MGITYSYDPAKNRLQTVCAGAVGLVDVVNHFHLLSLDTFVRPCADVLLDLQTMTTIPEPAQVPTLNEAIARLAARRPFGHCAVLVAGTASYEVGRIFISQTAARFVDARLFTEPVAAAEWLDATVIRS